MPLSLSQTTVAAGAGYSGFKFRAKKSKPPGVDASGKLKDSWRKTVVRAKKSKPPGVDASGKLKDSWRKTVDVCSVVEGSLKKSFKSPCYFDTVYSMHRSNVKHRLC